MNKNNYTYKKLGEVCKIQMGQSPESKTYNSDAKGLPFFQGNADFGEIYPTVRVYCDCPIRIAQNNDLLISVRAPIGAVNFADCKCCIGRGLASVRTIKGVTDEKYIFYFLKSINSDLNKQGTGSTFKSISKNILSNALVPVPPLATQRKIVAELDCLNNIIAKKRLQLQDYDSLAQALFYQTFGDPVKNDMGWEMKKLGEVCESVNYGTSSPSNENGKYKYIRMNNITYSGELDLHDLKYIDVADKDYEKYVVRKGDILFNRTNSKELVGKTTFFNEKEEMIIAGYIIRVRLMNNILPVFVARYMNTAYIKTYLREFCKSIIGQANINAKELQNILIYLPPLALQQQFAAKIEAIEAQKARIRQSVAEVQTLLNYTMDKYFG